MHIQIHVHTCMWSYICVGVWKCTSGLTVHVACMPHTIICVYTCAQHTQTINPLVHLHTYASLSRRNFSFFLLIFLRRLIVICFSVSSSKLPWYSHFKNISQVHRCWGVGGQQGHACASVKQTLIVGTPDTFRGWPHSPVQCERGLRGESMLRIWMWPAQTHRTHHLHQRRNSGRKGVPFSPESHQKQNP